MYCYSTASKPANRFPRSDNDRDNAMISTPLLIATILLAVLCIALALDLGMSRRQGRIATVIKVAIFGVSTITGALCSDTIGTKLVIAAGLIGVFLVTFITCRAIHSRWNSSMTAQ